MVKKTHTQAGVVVSLMTSPIVLRTLPNVENIFYIVLLTLVYIYGAYFGSVLPDIDMKGSYISKKMPVIYRYFGKYFKHRGFTHSILSLLMVYSLAKLISTMPQSDYTIEMFFSGIFIGSVSHILLDLFTKEGVELFYPVKKSISLAKLKTNSSKEKKLNRVLELFIFMVLGVNIYIIMFPPEQSMISRMETGNAKLQIQKD